MNEPYLTLEQIIKDLVKQYFESWPNTVVNRNFETMIDTEKITLLKQASELYASQFLDRLKEVESERDSIQKELDDLRSCL
jgi:hypothetical protein